MITREQIKLFLQNIASSHYNIHTFGWGDVPDLLAREKVIYPYMMVTPVPSTFEDGYINYGYLVSIADRIREGNQNEVEVDSDTFNIMMQVITQIDNLLYNDVDLVKGQTITPFMEAHRHRVSGHFSELQIRVKYNYDACAIPSDEVPLPLPPPPSCAVANYRVEYENGTLIEAGTIPSGGSKTIEVPDPSICANATWELRDEDGNLLNSGSVASGGSVTIEAPNADLLIRNSLNQTLYNLSLLSGSSGSQTIGDSSIRLEDSVGTLIANSSVVAEGSATITAPDGTVSVRKSDGVEIYSVDVRSNGTASQNVADSVAVLKDTAANVISSTNIKATETEDITAPDGRLQNSDASATLTVRSGELNKPIADINVEVNTVVEGTIPAIKDVKILITDGVNPVTPDDVSVVGDTVTVEVPSGGGTFDVDLVDRFGNAFPTKQVTANATWDLRTLTPFDWADIFLNTLTGTYTAGEEQAIIDFVNDLHLAGIWQRRRAIFPFVGGNAFDNSLNLKYPFDSNDSGRMLFIGSPTHNSNGITFASTNAALTNIPRGHLPINDLNVHFYSRTNSVVAGVGMDFTTAPLIPRTYVGVRDNGGDRVVFAGNDSFSTSGSTPDSSGGFHANYIAGANACKLIRNGDTSTPIMTLTNGSALGIGTLTLNGLTTNSNVQFPTNRNYAGFAVGLSLTDAQMLDDYTIWQQFQTDFNGRQV
jgi:hypothetical protein